MYLPSAPLVGSIHVLSLNRAALANLESLSLVRFLNIVPANPGSVAVLVLRVNLVGSIHVLSLSRLTLKN